MTEDEDGPAVPLSAERELIETNAADWAPDVLKTVLQMVPVVGPLAAFAIEQRPATQIKRVVKYLGLLGGAVSECRADLDALRIGWEERPEAANLFEQGIGAAARATSVERLERLAAIVADGLGANEVAAMNAARRLRVLGIPSAVASLDIARANDILCLLTVDQDVFNGLVHRQAVLPNGRKELREPVPFRLDLIDR